MDHLPAYCCCWLQTAGHRISLREGPRQGVAAAIAILLFGARGAARRAARRGTAAAAAAAGATAHGTALQSTHMHNRWRATIFGGLQAQALSSPVTCLAKAISVWHVAGAVSKGGLQAHSPCQRYKLAPGSAPACAPQSPQPAPPQHALRSPAQPQAGSQEARQCGCARSPVGAMLNPWQ